jgi:hypothetical protein
LQNDVEEAFARLEQLVDELPLIQEQDARLTRARDARVLREARERADFLQAEIEGYQHNIDKALKEAKAAADRGDVDEEGRNLGLLRMQDELRYTRLAAAQRAQDELRRLLEQGTLTLEDPLDDYALADDEYAALDARIRAFQEEYHRVFTRCQQLEDSG